MRRVLAYLLVWTVGTAATVGACWLGLRSVLDATTPRAIPFSAAELGRTSPPVPNSGTIDADGNPVLPSTTVGPSTVPLAGPTTSPAGAATSSSPPDSVGEAAPISSAVVSAAGWEPVPNGRGGTVYRRTFTVGAGTLTFECGPYDVDLIDVDLRSGYIVVPTRYDARSLLISLLSTQRTSRVYVAWRDGRPYAEITETVV